MFEHEPSYAVLGITQENTHSQCTLMETQQ